MNAISPELEGRLRALIQLVADAPIAATTVRSPREAWNLHVLDSLTGLESAEVAAAQSMCDIGAGAGFPGLVLALALPDCHITLVESVDKKVRLMERVAREIGIPNVTAVTARAEEWSLEGSEGREKHDVVIARALAPLPVLIEYASPLLELGGVLVAWKGCRDGDEDRAGEAAADAAGMAFRRVQRVKAFPGADQRHLYVYEKTEVTPQGLPRRPGMALKRPLHKK